MSVWKLAVGWRAGIAELHLTSESCALRDVVRMLEAERQAQLLGFSVAGDLSSLPEECNFVLSFDSEVVWVGRDDGVSRVTLRVNSQVPINTKEGSISF